MNPDRDDETLMLMYRRGDAEAFEVLYRRHRGGVYRYILRQCRDRAVADELFQDCWMNVIKSRERYEAKARFTTWLYRIAHNRVVDHVRRQAGAAARIFDDDAAVIDNAPAPLQSHPDNMSESQQTGSRLLALLDELPAEQRQVFLLREEAGLSIGEIAVTLGINHETTRSRLRYAVKKLRAGLEEFV